MVRPRILVVAFPSQGHINPALQFAKRLVDIGAFVTFATCTSADRRMAKCGANYPKCLSFATFSDGTVDGFKFGGDMGQYVAGLRHHGSETLSKVIAASVDSGQPFTCVVYSILLPWVGKVAREFHLPSTLLWLQAATILDIYYYYFDGSCDVTKKNFHDPEFLLELPGLPPLANFDLPSFFSPTNTLTHALAIFKEHIEILAEETNPKVLVNTFDELEREALKSIGKYNLVGVGPLIPSAFLESRDPSDSSFGGDLYESPKGYIEWLNTKPESSVIYISFGSLSVMSKPQMDQMALALLDIGHPFLWITREENKLNCIEDLEKQGKMLPWCSQVEVLSHPSVGCFLTHCGWNSTLESLTAGVPMVAFPQWTDQMTNAKLVRDVWKTGVRVRANEDGVVEGEEIKRCVELMMKKEMKQNAKKWKDPAIESFQDDGSSYKNLKAFVDEIGQACSFNFTD